MPLSDLSSLPGGVHLAQRSVEEHAQGHQQVDRAHAEDGRHQPGSLDHDAGQDGPEGMPAWARAVSAPNTRPSSWGGVCSWMTVEARGLMGPNSSPPMNPAATRTPSGGVVAALYVNLR
jgi:hypothetical protein